MKLRVHRYLSSIITILAAIIISFLLVRSMPGDFIHLRATEIQLQQNLSYQDAYAIAKTQYNYDPAQPLYLQFIDYFSGLLKGNLGYSLILRIPVSRIIAGALPWTLFLCSTSLFLSFALGSIIGLIVAYKRNRGALEPAVSFLSVLTQAIPDFIMALLLIVLFSVNLKWFPLRGAYNIDTPPGFNLPFILGIIHHAFLPITAYVLSTLGGWALTMKASSMSVLSEMYVRAARAKGLKEGRILTRYIGKNAIVPLIPGLAITFAAMFSSSMFVEYIFNYPGIGYFFSFSIANRDFTLLQGILLISIIVIVFSNLVADNLHAWLDPRVEL